MVQFYLAILFYNRLAKRKPILLIFKRLGIEYVEYDIRKFEESCCGELPTTKAPSVFAVEGIFKGLEKIDEYVSLKRNTHDSNIESESAYW